MQFNPCSQVKPIAKENQRDRVLTFLPSIEPGMYHFRYLARATTPGKFVVPPTRVECMYTPEVAGRTAATTFDIARKVATPRQDHGK